MDRGLLHLLTGPDWARNPQCDFVIFPLKNVAKLPFGVNFVNLHPSINSRVRVMVQKNKNAVLRQGAGVS